MLAIKKNQLPNILTWLLAPNFSHARKEKQIIKTIDNDKFDCDPSLLHKFLEVTNCATLMPIFQLEDVQASVFLYQSLSND